MRGQGCEWGHGELHDGEDRDDVLTVEFIGDRHRITPASATLTFGRAGDLVVDEANTYLHRVVGRFVWHNGGWWIENLGAYIELEVVGDDGHLSRLPPRRPGGDAARAALASPRFRVLFAAGAARYELVGALGTVTGPPAPDPIRCGGSATASFGDIPLTPDERALLVRLAEPFLRDPRRGPSDLPSNQAIAHALGWSLTKYNRKLDYLCTRLTKAGVPGLQGGRGAEATNRRWRLVEHAINARLVTRADLDEEEE